MTTISPSPRIAFQGERGAFSEEAAVKLMGEEIQLVPRPTFEALYAAIQDGLADYLLAPIENSLAGSVHRSYDLLIASGLHIQGEVVIPIVHNLIGPRVPRSNASPKSPLTRWRSPSANGFSRAILLSNA
jgi:prephenate dehydratase